jgi:ketosteroid isomerase-like protein
MGAKEVTDSIADFVDAVNKGDQARAIAHFSDDVTIIEDLAPFRWDGPNAGPEWMLAMWENAQRNNVSAIMMKISPPTRIEIEGGAAYAVVPGLLTYEGVESALRSDGLLTFSLKASGEQWLINGLTWSGPEAS